MNDQPDSGTSTDKTQHSQKKDIHAPGVSKPTIPASEVPQTHALDRAVTGIGTRRVYTNEYLINGYRKCCYKRSFVRI
jgi:hypothetical protein